ncbi:site-specific DNA-methyltransferase [Candidatus Parvarchaeota archaeon]|nr:site-specific DNA-methyltransferase [Candidatus Parvarchaeota archaeon]
MNISKLILGDCIEKMKELPAESIDAIITDPPYGLEFMGKEWDGFRTPLDYENWTAAWAEQAFRVMKTGGFLFSFGGTRTYHRMTCGIEDAGFQIRDCLAWTYASGFPKAQDLSGVVAKREGAKREGAKREGAGAQNTESLGIYRSEYREYVLTENAKQFIGWKTPALKPAFEPIVVAQKPIKGTIADNILKNRVGGYNVDECRIPYKNKDEFRENNESKVSYSHKDMVYASGHNNIDREGNDKGRFPPNLLSEDNALDNGKVSSSLVEGGFRAAVNTFSEQDKNQEHFTTLRGHDDEGSFNRYFDLDAWFEQQLKTLPKEARITFPFLYSPKAGKGEKNEGLEDWEGKKRNAAFCLPNPICLSCGGEKYSRQPNRKKCNCEEPLWKEPKHLILKNFHPTVKPVKICTYLIKLATMEGATILDPFMGSGTTGIAAWLTNRDFVGIELNEEYHKIAKARIGEYTAQQKLL